MLCGVVGEGALGSHTENSLNNVPGLSACVGRKFKDITPKLFRMSMGKDPLEKGMATHFSVLAWEIPRTEKPDRLPSMRSQRVGQN